MKIRIKVILFLILSLCLFIVGKNLLDKKTSEKTINHVQEINAEIKTSLSQDGVIKSKPLESSQVSGPANHVATLITEENNQPTITIVENREKPLIENIPNYVGWININKTQIDYPVVKTNNNDFYLDHNYDMTPNIAGAIYMDRRNLANTFDAHTIIYGHYMKNGSMFTDLNLYLEEDFYKINPIITFRDLYSTYQYKVFSAYYVSADDYMLDFDINNTSVSNMLSKALYPSDYSYSPQDRILTLSTCNYILNNGRMIVHAVLIK